MDPRPGHATPRNRSSPSTPGSDAPSSHKPSVPPGATRNPPAVPTPTELLALAVYPSMLVFGTVFALLSPATRALPYDTHYDQGDLAPSYFARKDNLFNVVFVKRGWAWVSVAFAWFAAAHPALGDGLAARRRVEALLRWFLVTAAWFLVTQWCFGAPLIDRGFRWTGGRCAAAVAGVRDEGAGETDVEFLADAFTAAACRAAGGRWSGGHDVSGHVFLLVLGSACLLQEVGWALGPRAGWVAEERSVVMHDGAVKGARVERTEAVAAAGTATDMLGYSGRFALGVAGLCLWMMLMTAIYFHTWFEKTTGLLVAGACLYMVYIVPRLVPALRSFVGLPGI